MPIVSRPVRTFVMLIALAALCTLAACGGNSTTTSSSSPASSSVSSMPASGSSSAGGAASGTGANGSGSGGGGTSAVTLPDQASQALDHDFTITYAMHVSTVPASSMTLFWQASKKQWRVDLGTETATITFIGHGHTTIYCLDAEKTCTKSTTGSAQTSQIPFFSGVLGDPDAFTNYVAHQLGTDVTTSTMRIAGQGATCYQAASGSTSGQICFGDSGLVLSWTGSVAGQQIGLVATKVSDSVGSNDFKPPYKVTSAPGVVLPP